MKLKLERPICFFDLESTSVDTEVARIVQIAGIKIFPDGKREEKNILINPEIKIPIECTEIHGITDEMVKDKPTFRQYAQGIKDWFYGSDIGGFNSDSYDVNLLIAEMDRAGITFADWDLNLLDVMKLYRKLYPNTLSEIFKRLFDEELDGAHNALNDVVATEKILYKILPEELTTVKEVDEFLQEDKFRVDYAGKLYKDLEGVVKYNFGKDKDKSVKAEPGFGRWMLNQSFSKDTKDKLKQILNG